MRIFCSRLIKADTHKEYFPNVLCSRDTTKDDSVSSQPEHDGLYQIGLLRFSREARILSTLQNVNSVVTVFDWFEGNNTAYIVMQFVRGIPLDQYVEKNAVSPQQLIAMMRDIVDGLVLVHKQGILHRDISPSNILVQDDGTLKLIDFGAATAEERRLQGKDQTVIFNKKYAPVEQYDENGMQGPWTDVYALSATLYALITGNPPPESVSRKGNDTIASLPAQNKHLKHWQKKAIMGGLVLRPEKRIQNMDIFRSVLYHLPLPEEEKKRRTYIARGIATAAVASLVSIIVTLNFSVGFNLGNHVFYSLRGDGFHAVGYSGKAEGLALPEKRLGIRVTGIETGAFQAAEELEELSIPGTVQSIGTLAFSECERLKTVILNNGIIELQPRSFAGCSNLQAVYIPVSLRVFYAETFNGSGDRFVLIGEEKSPSASIAEGCGLRYAQIDAIETESGVVVTAYRTDQKTAVIPDEINGRPVVGIYSGTAEVSVFPSTVTSIVLPRYLQHIGDYAFYGMIIEELEIPDTVREIGEYAFACSQLTSIHFPDSVETVGKGAFQTCIRLSEVRLSPKMGKIPAGCFEGAAALTNVVIPNGITEVGYLAFSRCDALATLTLPEGVRIVDMLAFQDCVSLKMLYLPTSLQRMHWTALNGCSNRLTLVGYQYAAYYADHYGYGFYDLRIQDSTIHITQEGHLSVEDESPESENVVLPSYAWDTVVTQVTSATGLKSRSVVLPEELKSVATKSFYANQYLESISAPASLKKIGYYSFALCKNLKEVRLLEGVEEIGSEAFLGCSGLEGIQLPNSVKTLGEAAFENCTNLSAVNIPTSLVVLESDVFANCGFRSFTIPGTLTKCRTTFYGCKQLKSLNIEEGVRILWGTFARCEALEEVYLPESIKQISRSTFLGCSQLRDVWIYSEDVELDYVYSAISHYESMGYSNEQPQGERIYLEHDSDSFLFSDSPELTLHGYRGSSVQVYAQEHGINFEVIPDARKRETKESVGFVEAERIYSDELLQSMITPQEGDSAGLCWGKFRYAYGYDYMDLALECLKAYAQAGEDYDRKIAEVSALFLAQQGQHGYTCGAPIAFFEGFKSHPTLQAGDIIVEIDGQCLSSNDDIRILREASGSNHWEYTVLRENGDGVLEKTVVEVRSEDLLCGTQNLSPQTFEDVK